MNPVETRILDHRSLAAFIAGRKVLSVKHQALTRGGSVALHIIEGGAIAAEVRDAGRLAAREVEEIGIIIAREQAALGVRETQSFLPKLPSK